MSQFFWSRSRRPKTSASLRLAQPHLPRLSSLRALRFSLVAVVLASAVASADTYDFRINQLGNPIARIDGPSGVIDNPSYNAMANANFRAFSRRLAAAMSSVDLMPPETLGHSAFAITAELSVISMQNANGDLASAKTEFPTVGQLQGALLMPSIHVRKGLPFSFELGARASWLEKSRMGAGTVELKWALNEGWKYIPDIGVRAYVTKLLNTRNFDVTTGGLDVGVGKQFAIAGMVTLTPYLGYNLGFTGATSSSVDFLPSRSLADSDQIQVPSEGKNFSVFDEVLAKDNTHNRFYAGLRFIGGYFTMGAEFSYTLLGSFTDQVTGNKVNIGSVLAFNATIGLDY